MKNIRTLLLAVSALAFVNVAHAQTALSTSASVSVTTPLLYSNDPMIQKRHADSVAKAEYKARKKAAKTEMKEERAEAKVELKADKAESTEVRNTALIANPIVPKKP